jgi:nitrate/TMAO reductase-like tetraheme cytochrome c subunit
MQRLVFTYSLIIILIIGLMSGCKSSGQTNSEEEVYIKPITKHWEKPIPHLAIPEGLESISAKTCGTCHQDIYNEWKTSTHAIAYQDIQFQAEMKKDNMLTCLNCHIPLQDQQEFIVKGFINGDYKTPLKEENPQFDKALLLESITCATCHIRNGRVIGASGINTIAHKTETNRKFLSEKLCMGCHNVVDELSPVLVCTFETGDEWNNHEMNLNGKNCISCHMPETERLLLSGYEKRKGHFHGFPGSGIPKFFDVEANGLQGLEIKPDKIDSDYAIGDDLKYSLTVRNSFAGHSVPTGDPERFILITFKLLDFQEIMIKEEVHRIGEEWQWYPTAKKLSDNNLKPLEERIFNFEYSLVEKGEMTLVVEVTKHRMTEANAKYNGILGQYPLFIEIFVKQYQIYTK